MLQLWSLQEGTLASHPMNEAVNIADGEPSPQLVPANKGRGHLAALLVPDRFHGAVVLNGAPVSAGVQPVGHAERIDIAGRSYWMSVGTAIETEIYHPDGDETEDFCFITKAKLVAEMPIVRCPGQPGHACGILYKQEAWELAIAANPRFRCPHCGFDPTAGQWQPTLPKTESLQHLFALARLRGLPG